MKRIFTYISLAAAAFALASCVDEVFPTDESGNTEPTVAPDVDIKVSEVKDSSFVVTITPTGAAAYYSYLIDQDSTDYSAVLDPEDLYAVGYEGVAQGTVSYAKQDTTVLEIEASPYTYYTVYAVAASKEGNVGTIVSKTFQTSDSVAPFFLKDEDGCYEFDNADSLITLYVSEDVTYDSTKAITAKIWYGCNNQNTAFVNMYKGIMFNFVNGSPYEYARKGKVAIEDGEITINFGEMPAGALYQITVPEGAFFDAAGNVSAGLASSFTPVSGGKYTLYNLYNTAKPTGFSVVNDVYGWCETSDIDCVLPTETLITSSETQFQISFPSGYYVDNYGDMTTVVTRVSEEGGVKSTTTLTYSMKYNTNWGQDKTYWAYIWVKPAGDLKKGDQVTIVIPEGFLQDSMGNRNKEEIVLGPFTDIEGLTAADVEGQYKVEGTSGYEAYGAGPYTDYLSFKAAPKNAEDDTTMIVYGTITEETIDTLSAVWDASQMAIRLPAGQYLFSFTEKNQEDTTKIDTVGVYAYLSNGSSPYTTAEIAFNYSYPHSLGFKYLGKAYLGMVAVYGPTSMSWYDQIWAGKCDMTYVGAPATSSVPACVAKPASVRAGRWQAPKVANIYQELKLK